MKFLPEAAEAQGGREADVPGCRQRPRGSIHVRPVCVTPDAADRRQNARTRAYRTREHCGSLDDLASSPSLPGASRR